MNKLIARLIDSGYAREEALAIFGKFKREGRLDEFELFVDRAEQMALEGDQDGMDPL